MGVYRWYVVFPLILFSSLSYSSSVNELNLHSSLTTWPTDAECTAKPVITYTMVDWIVRKNIHYAELYGCVYRSVKLIDCAEGSGKCKAQWQPFMSYGSLAKPDDKPSGDPDNSDNSDDTPSDGGDTGNTGGDSTQPIEPHNPDITPPVKPPVKPDTSSVGQLFELYSNCISDLAKFPLANYDDYNPAIDYNYNARAKQCNSIYDNMSSLVTTNSMSSPSDDNHQFLTKDGSGNLYGCRRNPYTPQEWADVGKLYPGEILGNQVIKAREREIGYNCRIEHDPSDDKDKNRCNFHLNFNYGTDNGKGTTVCNSVYNANSGSGDSGTGSPGGSCPAGHYLDDNLGCLPVSSYPCNAGSHPDLSGSGRPVCVPDSGSGGDTDSGDDNGPGLSTPSLDVPELTLSPLWNIWPSARDFKLSLPAAQCPVFNIEVFGTNHKIDTFCTLFTPDIIAIIRAICILTASIISFIIVLRS